MLTSFFASEFVSFAIYPDFSDVVTIDLDRVVPELDCVVVYLLTAPTHRQGWQTRLSSTGSSIQTGTEQQPAGAGRAWETA